MIITDKMVDSAISKACEFEWLPIYSNEQEFEKIVRQMREVLEAAQQADGLCEHGKGHCQCDNPRCPNYCD